MSDPMACLECRAGWLDFRDRLGPAGIAPERRGEVIKEYLRLFHLYDHDEARVRAHVEEASREFVLRSLVEQARDWIAGEDDRAAD